MKKRILQAFFRFGRKALNQGEKEFGYTFFHNSAVHQKNLQQLYRCSALQNKESLPALQDAGFRVFSQFEEDGMLLYIFSLIKPLNRKCVEICAGNGRENMTSNLIINHGWWGYLFDGNPHSVEAGTRFFSKNKDTYFAPPKFTNAWITAENVNDLIAKAGATGPIDLLSLDMDGTDYWIWKAINVIQPQVVVCETHNGIPADKALTIPYDPKFVFEKEEFRSASLAAMTKLGREKGYRLVGTHRFGFNAFFIKLGVGEEYFPEVTVEECLQDPVSTELRRTMWPRIQGYNWQGV